MVKFESKRVQAGIKRKRLYDNINKMLLAVFILFGAVSAVCTLYIGDLDIWFWCVTGGLIAVILLYNIIFVAKAGRQVRYEVSSVLAEGFYQDERLLQDGADIAFEVFYSGNVLTVKRADATCGDCGEIEFDLTALKPLPSVYSCAGNYVWQFLQAYYTAHFKEGKYENVHVTDRTTKRVFTLDIIERGEPISTKENGYFIKKGLVK